MNQGVHEFCNLFAILAHKSHKFSIKIRIINDNNMLCVHKKTSQTSDQLFLPQIWANKCTYSKNTEKNEKNIMYIEFYFLSTIPLVQLYMPPPVDPARVRAMYKSTTLFPNNTNSQKTCKRQTNDKRLTFMSFSALPLSRQFTDIFYGPTRQISYQKILILLLNLNKLHFINHY